MTDPFSYLQQVGEADEFAPQDIARVALMLYRM